LYTAVKNNPRESKRDWMLRSFDFAGKDHPDNLHFKVWQDDYHPVCLNQQGMFEQRMEYLHQNPVKAGWVWEPQHFKYSSAIDYNDEKPGLLPLVIF
jgi:putative transposase